MENFGISLWITLIGMGLVFIAIILLWGLMSFLVSVLKDKEDSTVRTSKSEMSSQDNELKERIAAVAVAIAINTTSQSQYQGEHPDANAVVSNWQSSFRQTSS